MNKELQSVIQLHVWNKKVLGFGGMWPLEKNYLKFYIGIFYFVTHLVLTLGDFLSVFGDLTLSIANLLETSTQIMVGAKIAVLRYSTLLRDVLKDVQSGARENRYLNEEEKNIYLSYNSIGRFFFRTASCFSMATILSFFIKPFEDIARAGPKFYYLILSLLLLGLLIFLFLTAWHNETIPYVLPCRMTLFMEITNSKTYALFYLSQCPMIYYYYVYTISSCFLCTVMVHVAGDLSVLAYRIRHINSPEASRDYGHPEIAFRNIVIEHKKIILTVSAINDIFNFVLLLELSISTVLIGLTCYNVLVKSVSVSMTDFFFIVNYSIIVLILIFIYCTTGDYLISESMNVHDAYYECLWYDMGSEYRKHLMICMCRAQIPLQLTAGRFYVFSRDRFTEILKTSMAYISMLRTVND